MLGINKKTTMALIVGSVFMLQNTAYAMSGDQFVEKCERAFLGHENETPQEAVTRALQAGSCSGYVGGVINGINLVGNMLGQRKALRKNFVCLPKGKQAQELVQEVVAHIKKNPSTAPAQLSVYNAMTVAYPCEPFVDD